MAPVTLKTSPHHPKKIPVHEDDPLPALDDLPDFPEDLEDIPDYEPPTFSDYFIHVAALLSVRCFSIVQRAPLDRVLWMMQVRGELVRQGRLEKTDITGIVSCFRYIWNSGGFVSFFRGTLFRVGSLVPLMAASHICSEPLMTLLDHLLVPRSGPRSGGLLQMAGMICANGLGYSVHAALAHPIELMHLRLVCDVARKKRREDGTEGDGEKLQFQSGFQVLRDVVRSHGIAAIYRGFSLSLFNAIVGNTVYFALFDRVYCLAPGIMRSVYGRAFVNLGISIAVSLMTFPLDTIRRRLMLTTCESEFTYTSVGECIRTIRAESGLIRGLFDGAQFMLGRTLLNFAWGYIKTQFTRENK